MSEESKTLVAYIVGVCILMFAWSVLRTWEPALPGRGAVMESTQRQGSSPTVAPRRLAAE